MTSASIMGQGLLAFADPAFVRDALNMAAALGLGAIIGFERQWRQRMAGQRANTLVALGTATFVIFGVQISEANPSVVAAQVVTGIGFLGAGVISKEGVNVRSLNTAATLWWSGAVGLLAGVGHWAHAVLATALVIFVNLVLRPLVELVNRQIATTTETESAYVITVICRSAAEANIRILLMQGLNLGDLHLRELDSSNIEGSDRVEVRANVRADKRRDIALEHLVGQLCLENDVTAAKWRVETSII